MTHSTCHGLPNSASRKQEYVYGVASISRLLKIIGLFAEYRLFNRVLLQKRPTILRGLLLVATTYAYDVYIYICIYKYIHILCSILVIFIHVHVYAYFGEVTNCCLKMLRHYVPNSTCCEQVYKYVYVLYVYTYV